MRTSTPVTDYTMALSDSEIARYRLMAAEARKHEQNAWIRAGIEPGARVVDVGCGPAAVLVELANAVGISGEVVGVERDALAREAASQMIRAAGVGNARVVPGEAAATNLEPATYDVVMMRHVLLHNGAGVESILSHLTTLLRPGGHLYLLETDPLGWRRDPDNDDIADCFERWFELMRRQGNDLLVAAKLGRQLLEQGLEVIDRSARYAIIQGNHDQYWRGGPWAARKAIVEAGLATHADVNRWDAAFHQVESLPGSKVFFTPFYRAIGRRP